MTPAGASPCRTACRDWVSLEADKKNRLRVPGPFRQEKEDIRKYLYPYKRRTTADMIVQTVSAVVMFFRLFQASGMSVVQMSRLRSRLRFPLQQSVQGLRMTDLSSWKSRNPASGYEYSPL